ncbi:MAG: transposase [Gracilimonas sp.]
MRLKRERNALFGKYTLNQSRSDRLSDLRVKIHKHIFNKYDQFLDEESIGPTWLAQAEIANIVKEAIHYRDTSDYDLYAYCIMSNHVHLVFKLPDPKSVNPEENEDFPVTKILKSLKWYSAFKANQVLGRTGKSFWQAESYDHVIRNSEELERVIYYTLQNPVKPGLVDNWKEWPHSYCKPDFKEAFINTK